MSYRIIQDADYVGADYWSWSACIDATPDELDQVESVVWILHPTFEPSRVENRSRQTGFKLTTSGWGTFLLRAELHLRGGELRSLSHMLRLNYPNDEEAMSSAVSNVSATRSAPTKRVGPKVFLSYASEDESHAQQVRSSVERMGGVVVDARSIRPDLPIDAAIRKLIRESDGVVSLLRSDYASPSVIQETKLAKAEEKPLLEVVPEEMDPTSGPSFDVGKLTIGESSAAIDSQLAGFVETLTSG